MIALDMGPEVEGLRKTIQRLKDKKSQYEERVEELKLEITLRCENISKLNNMIEQYQCDLNNRLRQITIPLQRGGDDND